MSLLSGCLALTLFLNFAYIYPGLIQNYRPYFAVCKTKENAPVSFAIRKYSKYGIDFLLVVDAKTMRTSVIEKSCIKCVETGIDEIRKDYSNTNYVESLVESEKNAKHLQNAGITHFRNVKGGAVLTADLCPSKLPLDKIIFNRLINDSGNKLPVPVALAVSGLWMEKHTEDIRWLMDLEYKGLISITWINHSYNHAFYISPDLINNFMLQPGTNCNAEVLKTEMKMLELGLYPSVFFRFPGLVSNRDLLRKITGYGLIPIGSKAWLAKFEQPKDGSIILIHANGHEPVGIERFNLLLDTENKKASGERRAFLDLRDSAAMSAGKQ
jgi:hypothetical protein